MWIRTVPKSAWRALFAAQAGWMLDAMDFVLYIMAIPVLQAEFGFDAKVAGLLATAALLTSAFGGFFFGWLSDKIGRTRSLMLTILVFSFASLGTATSQSVAQLFFWRAVLGLGMGGEWAAGATLVSETWPPEHRGKAIGIMQSGWALGYIAAALLAALVLPTLGWRWLFALGVLPALLTLWIRRSVAEPKAWREAPRAARPPLGALFRSPLGARTAAAVALSTAVMFGYWGLFTWLPSFLASPIEKGGAGLGLVKSTAWIIPMQIGAFLGYLSFGFISDKLGRRPSVFLFLTAAAIVVPIYGMMARSPNVLMVLGPLVGFFGHGYFSVFGALLAELFPTELRGTSQGFCYNAGRAMSALAPTTIGVLATTMGLGTALMITSAFFLTGAGLIFLLPETRGHRLVTGSAPETMKGGLAPTVRIATSER